MSKELYSNLIQQNNHELIPFSIFVEEGISDDSVLSFEIENASDTNFDYSVIISNANSSSTTTSQSISTYMPEDEESEFQHNNVFHIDIFANDKTGIKKVNARTQKEIYEYKDPEYTYNAPKFTWSNNIFYKEVGNTNKGSVWIGENNDKIHRVYYDSEYAEPIKSSNVNSEPYFITFEKNSNKGYITLKEDLVNASLDDYYSNVGSITSTFYVNNSVSNSTFSKISYAESDKIWVLESYYGKVLEKNPDNFSTINEYSGFDAPSKIKWSKYHNCYFISGTNILWKLKNGQKESVYNIKDYEIIDFDISEDGYICLLFNGDNDDLIRILKPDLFSLAVNESINDGSLAYCIYCDQGIFYILIELLSTNDNYNFKSYLYNYKTGNIESIEDSSSLSTTTTTTTQTAPTNKVEVLYPSGGENLEKGSEIEITWKSSQSANDLVKIELYKGVVLNSVITLETQNTGVFKWDIPENLLDGINYNIKITWIGTTELPENYDFGNDFRISTSVATTTTTTTATLYSSIGIGYNATDRQVVNVLKNGLLGYFDLNEKLFYGLFETGVEEINCMAVKSLPELKYSNVSSIRVFVGSEEYLSDMWDSGIIETNKNSIYYGGGNNLVTGQTYYVNIQVYDSEHGWSGVQTKEWEMPK